MSLDFIQNFQVKIFTLLSEIPLIKEKIKKIYVAVKQDGAFPFIFVNISKVKDLSLYEQSIYEVDFSVSIYSKEGNSNLSLAIASVIKDTLNREKCCFGRYDVAGIKNNEMKFDLAPDLTTNKLTLSYKTLIKEKKIL